MSKNIEDLKELSKGYKDIAAIIDEMIAYEENKEENPEKEALLTGKLIMKMIELQELVD